MTPRRVLLIRPDHLGDLILSLPVAQKLKEAFPDCQQFYLIAPQNEGLKSLVTYVDGWIIDRGPRGGRLSLAQLTSAIKDGGFDYLIELMPSWRSAAAGFFAGVPNRIGTSRRFFSFFYSAGINIHRRGSGFHQTDLELAMLAPLGIDSSGVSPELTLNDDCRVKSRDLIGSDIGKYIVIHPTSSGSASNWPAIHYQELAKRILSETDLSIVITGGSDHTAFVERCVDLQGKTDLEALAGIVAGAELFISGSTGPLHLADSLGTTCLSFFVRFPGVEPERWGPRRNIMNILMPPNDICKCTSLSQCRCLEQITPGMVFWKVVEVLGLNERRTTEDI